MWEMYDYKLDGTLDGHLTRPQLAKLIFDLRLQLDDHMHASVDKEQ